MEEIYLLLFFLRLQQLQILLLDLDCLVDNGGRAMKDYDLATRREIEIALLAKGQKSKRYKLGEIWELNYDEIREALDELIPSYTKNSITENKVIDDMISRRKAISKAKELYAMGDCYCDEYSMVGMLNSLLSE